MRLEHQSKTCEDQPPQRVADDVSEARKDLRGGVNSILDNLEGPVDPRSFVARLVDALPDERRQVNGRIRTGAEIAAAIPDVDGFYADVVRMRHPVVGELFNANGQLVIIEGSIEDPVCFSELDNRGLVGEMPSFRRAIGRIISPDKNSIRALNLPVGTKIWVHNDRTHHARNPYCYVRDYIEIQEGGDIVLKKTSEPQDTACSLRVLSIRLAITD